MSGPKQTMIQWRNPDAEAARDFLYQEAKNQQRSVQKQIIFILLSLKSEHEKSVI